MEQVVLRGLPCRLHLVTKDSGWSCLEVDPLPGFVDLATPEQLVAWFATGWRYHVTLGHVPAEALAEVRARWDGAEVLLWIWRVNDPSCVARLDSRGVGECPHVLRALRLGDPDRAWFGLHISM